MYTQTPLSVRRITSQTRFSAIMVPNRRIEDWITSLAENELNQLSEVLRITGPERRIQHLTRGSIT